MMANALTGFLLTAVVVLAGWSSVGEDPQPAPPTLAERLMEQHDCWTGEAPDDIIPGHAVVTLPGRGAELVPSDVGFGIWLDGDDGRLHAFCE